MIVNTFYYSNSDTCGISIFNGHLRRALSRIGVNVLDTNLRTAERIVRTPIGILHYVPGSYSSRKASNALIELLAALHDSQRLFVILHGLHSYGESRFPDGKTYPQREEHVRLVLQRAEAIIALSGSVARAYHTWRVRLGGPAMPIRLEHPGLFEPIVNRAADSGYALVGGISRTKKVYAAPGTSALFDACRRQDIRVWEHWSNVLPGANLQRSWRQTFGLVNDFAWSTLVSNARVVLCPYQTQVQSVSGLISEALSAGRCVLTTSFDLALEMRERYPALVFVEDDLKEWPYMINHLQSTSGINCTVPGWRLFASAVTSEIYSRRSLRGREEQRVPVLNRWRVRASTVQSGNSLEVTK